MTIRREKSTAGRGGAGETSAVTVVHSCSHRPALRTTMRERRSRPRYALK
jgi:hypothetical protein